MKALGELLGDSPGIVAVRSQVQRLSRQISSRRPPPILIEGETGTGKGLLARLIHGSGARADRPFVDVNCAAIPATLLEAELFGYERGAFTDARQAKPGLFQLAHGGTIFLDEIGLLPDAVQAKLLKVIEERSVRRLGGTRTEPVDAVVISATNEDLAAATRAGRFRVDLYHRLAVLRLWLPPLRERGDDIIVLAERHLEAVCADYGLPIHRLAEDARAALRRYRWPGNVRELRNVIERAALLADAPVIRAAMLGLREDGPASAEPATPLPVAAAPRGGSESERDQLEIALREAGGNISRAAARLGLTRNTIRYRMEKYGLRPEAAPTRRGGAAPAVTIPPAPAAFAVEAPAPARPAGGTLRWEERRITFLRVAVRSGPEAFSPAASRLFAMLVEKVQTFGGAVQEVGGASVIAAFGLEPVEDAPRRAVKAAMAMQRALAQEHDGGARLSVGIHVASAMIGRVGVSAEVDGDAKREALAVLTALTDRPDGDGIVVSAAAAPFLSRRFDLVALAGAAGRVYRLAGTERAGLGVAGRMAPFVGRHHELQLLRTGFEWAVRGKGQVVGIAGDSGIGKSRLLFEFRQSIPEQPVTYLESQCLSYGRAIPYLPVLGILRAIAGITDRDSPEALSERVRAILREVGLDTPAAADCLVQLLGVGTPAEEGTDPQALRTRTFETLVQLVLRWSQRQPLVIVIEDLHWSDATSLDFFTALVDTLGGARVLLVFTYRPGYRAPWLEKSYATQVALQPLAPSDSAVVLHSLLPGARVPAALAEALVAKADGNPFFLEELCRTVLEQEHLPESPAVPDTVQEVLLARIDRLPPREKRLLQAVAVIGRRVPFSVALAVGDLPGDDLRDAFGRLQTAEFLQETNLDPDLEYSFKHGLTHETAYGSLREDERRALHARIVEAMESLYAKRLAEHVDALALHAVHGEVWDKAVDYCRQAGARAAARSANREAVTCFDNALAALERLPETPSALATAVDIRFDLRNALQPLGDFARIAEHLARAESVAIALGDRARLGRVLAYLTDYWRLLGERERALETGRRALGIAEAHGDFQLQVVSRTWLGQIEYARGRYAESAALLRRNVETLVGERQGDRLGMPQLPAVHSRACLAWSLCEQGYFAEALAVAEEGARIAAASDHALTRTVAAAGLGITRVHRGDFAEAVGPLEEALALCRTANLPLWFPRVASALGVAYAMSRRLDEALPLLEQAVSRSHAMGLMGGHSLLLICLGHGENLARRTASAREHAEQGRRLARQYGERGFEAWSLRLLAAIARPGLPGSAVEAEGCCHEGAALARELGMRPLLAHFHLALGQIAARLGKRAEALAELAAAEEGYRETDMPFWLTQVEAERRSLA